MNTGVFAVGTTPSFQLPAVCQSPSPASPVQTAESFDATVIVVPESVA